jgi:phosphoribosylglycinamide formyltransferase-1
MRKSKNMAGEALNIAVFASHNGSNLQAIIDACRSGQINANVCVVLSNNANARALQRAKDAGIDSYYVSTKALGDDDALDAEILNILSSYNTDIVFLAGYLKKIGTGVLRKYHNRIFNIHPALLPKYGGKGMYGMNVHKAVIEAKETVSGITIHRANQEYDEGEVVAQTTVAVSPDDTAETLAEKILAREHTFIVEVLNKIVDGRILVSAPT